MAYQIKTAGSQQTSRNRRTSPRYPTERYTAVDDDEIRAAMVGLRPKFGRRPHHRVDGNFADVRAQQPVEIKGRRDLLVPRYLCRSGSTLCIELGVRSN